MKAKIILEDGTIIIGKSFGSNKTICGELVFNTGMTGYQEILTDPSYAGQIVTMTYPLIGNYGINNKDFESNNVHVNGFIVKENAINPHHWQCEKTIGDYLFENDIPGIYEVDTRMLTKKIRNKGAMKCMITTEEIVDYKLLNAYNFPKDILDKISRKEVLHIEGTEKKIGLIDLGIKNGILQQFKELKSDLYVFPWDTTAEELLSYSLDAVLYSNGPGDPKDATKAIESAKNLFGEVPLWGICLGHQVLALALGADTYKLKFGHRGSNHPIIELDTNKVFMSSQNHGYAVKESTFTNDMKKSYENVNDNTIEGFDCEKYKIRSVQFHPEEGPGPEDAHFIFKKWIESL